MPPLLIFAIGNPSRGDDAFGPVMAERIEQWLHGEGQAWRDHIELICEQQLAVEHLLDLEHRQAVLFIDANASSTAPEQTSLTHITPQARPEVNSHQCPPALLLGLCQHLRMQSPPPAMLLSAQGHGFGLGAPLSAPMQAALPQAWQQFEAWLAHVAPGASPAGTPPLSAGACAS